MQTLRIGVLLTLVVGSAVLLACSRRPTNPRLTGMRYPLSVGNMWQYEQRVWNVHSDSSTGEDDTTHFIVDVRSLESQSAAHLALIHSQNLDGTLDYESEDIYEIRDDGLYKIAECGGVGHSYQNILPKKTPTAILESSLPFRSVPALSAEAHDCDEGFWSLDVPFLVLKYPVSGTWVCSESDAFGTIEKVVRSTQKVTTIAGTFE